jgi:hypothetical protein
MATIRALCTHPMTSSIGRDAATNTFHFNTLTAWTTTIRIEIVAALKAFYDAAGAQRSQHLAPAQSHVAFYDLAMPKPRAPIEDVSLGLSTSQGTNAAPHEIALCVSYQAIRASGIPQARRRGRIYLGPFASSSMDGTNGRPSNTCRTAIVAGANALLSASNSAINWKWIIHSPTHPEAEVTNTVTNGWVDDEWDIQRRRGLVATGRTIFP